MELEGFWLKDDSKFYNGRPNWTIYRNEGDKVVIGTIRLLYGRLRVNMLMPDGGMKQVYEDYPSELEMDHYFVSAVSRDKYLTRALKALQFQLDARDNGWEDEENS